MTDTAIVVKELRKKPSSFEQSKKDIADNVKALDVPSTDRVVKKGDTTYIIPIPKEK